MIGIIDLHSVCQRTQKSANPHASPKAGVFSAIEALMQDVAFRNYCNRLSCGRLPGTDDVGTSSNLSIMASRLHKGRTGLPRVPVLSEPRPAETPPAETPPDAAGSESSLYTEMSYTERLARPHEIC